MRAVDAKHFWLEARFERREGWDASVYPFNLPAVRWTETLVFHPKVTFLIGENGAVTRAFLNRREAMLQTLLGD